MTPLGGAASGILFAALGAGSSALQRDAGVPSALASIVPALAVLGLLLARGGRTAESDPMTGFVEIALLLSAPLLLAATGELLLERAGSIQIGLEGTMLVGAYVAFAAGRTGLPPEAALAAAAFAGLLAGLLFALFAVARRADPILVGTVWNLLALGATAFAYRLAAGETGSVLEVRTLARGLFGIPDAVAASLPRPRRPPPLARANPRRAAALGGRRESGGAPLARPLRRGRPKRRRRRVRRPRRARRRDAHPHGLTDLRRRGHRRTRLPGPRSRRLRALEAARPPSGRAPSRRRHRPPVPASGRRLRAPLRLLHRPPRPRGARGARPRLQRGGAPKALGSTAP